MNHIKKINLFITACLFMLPTYILSAQKNNRVNDKDKIAYLFTYFTGNKVEEEAICYAVSLDGYNYLALNGNKPVLDSKQISSTGGVRDPHILRGEDGKTFYMVATDMTCYLGWDSNRAMVLMKSTDLIHWKSSVVNIQKRFPGNDDLKRVWAPQTIYDAKAGKYMVYWAMKNGDNPDKIYYAYANADFTDLETNPQQLFFPENGKSCIDADIICKNGTFHLFYKTEGNGNGIKQATTTDLTSGKWVEMPRYMQATKDAVEGSCIFKMANSDKYILMYDVYGLGKYQFTESTSLDSFKIIDNQISMDFHPRHGTILTITRSELKNLLDQWGKPAGLGEMVHNPVLEGYYADPEILYAEKTKKYYLYPTTDGFDGWSGTYFKTLSSSNLIDWKDEGVIVDLLKDVPWGKRNAWAPCIIEKKQGKNYKYYYYFCNAQKVGVAVADDPAGPFKAAEKPIVDQRPQGAKGGQEIDPDVFCDPKTGKNYLYWGNGYMAVAELNQDMTSIREQTVKIITPDNTFREGTYVFYRKGTYYFMWSEDDTRSPDYSVRYGTSTSPLGPITIPAQNKILCKDTTLGIYGTGHNSVLQIPGTDEWYMVYHRFNYPEGIHMGDAAGYNREVCIDKLEFNADGSIKPVKPTHSGIQSLSGKKK